MEPAVREKLSRLNNDFKAVMGRAPKHFYCPILHRDDDVELCKGHVIPSSFADSDRTWTVQRKDVDSVYGSLFESEFEKLQHRGKHRPLDLLGRPELAKKLRPKFLLEGKEVDHYQSDGPLPRAFSPIAVQGASGSARLALKLTPEETLAALDRDWKLMTEVDLRLPALVSLLKAAHLTLFEIVGYRYALSAGGHFVGWEILGDYYLSTLGTERKEKLRQANEHFPQFVNMVRPMLAAPEGLEGTVTDRLLYLCMERDAPWAIVVLVRTGEYMHSVLLPVFEEVERSVRFLRFLKDPPKTIEITLAKYAGDHWDVSTTSKRVEWPSPRFAEAESTASG